MKLKIKKGDQVEIITGRSEDIGKRGEVIRVSPKEKRVVVQGIHINTKHQKQVQSEGKNINPGIVKLEGTIDISNVMLVCRECNKPTRIGIERKDGKPVRVCRSCNARID